MNLYDVIEDIEENGIERINWWFSQGLTPEKEEPNGKNLLHIALDGSDPINFSIVEELVSLKIPVDSKTAEGWTRLHFAARQHYVEAVKLLNPSVEDVNTLNCAGEPPLITSIQFSVCTETLSVLIDLGTDLVMPFEGKSLRSYLAQRFRHNKTILELLELDTQFIVED